MRYMNSPITYYIRKMLYSLLNDLLSSKTTQMLDALIWAVVCLLDALRIQVFAGVGNEWSHSALRYH